MSNQDDVIYAYTRKQALEDGEQVDANVGDLAEVTRQHYKYPLGGAMKSQIYSINVTISNFGPGFINAVIEISRDPHYNDQAKLDTHMYAHVTRPSFFRMQRAQYALCNGDFWTPPNNGLHATDLFDELSAMSDAEYQNHLERKADGA